MNTRSLIVVVCILAVLVVALAAMYVVERRDRTRAKLEAAELRIALARREAVTRESAAEASRMKLYRRSPDGLIRIIDPKEASRPQILDAPGPGYRAQRASMESLPLRSDDGRERLP